MIRFHRCLAAMLLWLSLAAAALGQESVLFLRQDRKEVPATSYAPMKDHCRGIAALSPQGVGPIFPPNAWREISKPVLMITGTRDDGLGGASWETRQEAYKNMPEGCHWLGIIDDATHMHFAGRGMSRRTEALTVHAVQEFLLGFHQGDCRQPQREPGIAMQVK